MISLQSSRLMIRDHHWDDLDSHHKILSDQRVMYYLKDLQCHSLEESRNNLMQTLAEIGNPRRQYYFFRIELLDSLKHVGEIGYTVTDFIPLGKQVELGYFTYERFWGKGYVTEAVKRVMEFAFRENDVFRISTGCIQDNIGSERVMQKCGMTKEAHYIQQQWHHDRMKDRVVYRMLRDEWISLSSNW